VPPPPPPVQSFFPPRPPLHPHRMVINTNVKLMLTGELLRIRPIPHRNCKKYTEREKLEERERQIRVLMESCVVKGVVDDLLILSNTIGADYTGRWATMPSRKLANSLPLSRPGHVTRGGLFHKRQVEQTLRTPPRLLTTFSLISSPSSTHHSSPNLLLQSSFPLPPRAFPPSPSTHHPRQLPPPPLPHVADPH
jgi:hypothetical protein